MRIKEAAARCKLTEKAIRLYEEKGLIIPTITEINGRKFRDYDEDTVRMLETIAGLRKSFFSIEQITEMQDDPEKIPEVFSAYRSELHTQFEQLSVLIARADALEPTAIRSVDVLSAALRSDSADSLQTPDGVSVLTEEAQKLPLPPVPDFHFRIWDEDRNRDERERAYEKYLRGYTRWEFFYDISLALSRFWKPIVFGVLPLIFIAICICTLPLVTDIDIIYEGYEIHFDEDWENYGSPVPYSAPIYSKPVTLHLKGTLYNYLLKTDYYEGEVNIDGFAPHIKYYEYTYTLEEEFSYTNNFTFEISAPGMLSYVYGALHNLKRIDSRDYIGCVYASDDLESLAFQMFKYRGSDAYGDTYSSASQWLIFPTGSSEEASNYYWTRIWQEWQKGADE